MKEIEHLYNCFLQSTGISTDSRKIEARQLFFALSGDNFNGNKFALSALEKGASFVVVDEQLESNSDQIIRVENTLTALQNLATHHREQLGTTIIAITGSNGKTTTKELLYYVLASQYDCHYTKGNFNNHIGVPLTLLDLESKHELAIVEMGANHQKEIHDLCLIAKPDLGIITNIGKAHLEGFGGIEGVIKGKSELYDYLKLNKGIIFYNGEDELLEQQIDGYEEAYKYFPSGILSGKDESNYLSFVWKVNEVMTNLTGQYNIFNIAAAIFVGSYFKVLDENIVNAISEYTPTNNRSQILEQGGVEYFLDAYNANPTSMSASLSNFFRIEADNKVLILGDMLELGDASYEEHKELVNHLATCEFDGAYLVGEEFSKHENSSDQRIQFFPDTFKLKEYFSNNPITKESKVLLKGSRGIGLEKLLA